MTSKSVPGTSRSFNIIAPIACLIIMHFVGFFILQDREGSFWPAKADLRQCDADWYHSLATNGYLYSTSSGTNSAFFPLFSYLWRWSHLSDIGIAILNGVLFVAGCFALLEHFKSHWKVKLFYLSVSILLFFVVPFSESLFYCFATAILIGLDTNKKWLTTVGVVGAGFTRSVGAVFIPAFLIIACYTYYKTRKTKDARQYLLYAFLSLCVILAVFTIQWYQTGEFFAFSTAQKYWGIEWRMPVIPFNSWPPEDNTYYDQFALFTCLLGMAYMFWSVFGSTNKQATLNNSLLFSLLYFSGLWVLVLFNKGGSFTGMNRYIFSTPFIYLFLRELKTLQLTRPMVVFILLVGSLHYFVCWDMGSSLERAGWASGVILLTMFTPTLLRNDKTGYTAAICCIAGLMLYAQCHFWYRYVIGVWVG